MKLYAIIVALIYCLTAAVAFGQTTTIITPDGRIVTCIQTGSVVQCW